MASTPRDLWTCDLPMAKFHDVTLGDLIWDCYVLPQVALYGQNVIYIYGQNGVSKYASPMDLSGTVGQ